MDESILFFIFAGFIAQIIDGALGMGYGVSLTTLLLSFGVQPAPASASVHAAEVFTTAASGLSHWKLGNINWSLVKKLAVPGVVGAVIGAYILTAVSGDAIKPYIAIYLALMGVVILIKAFHKHTPTADMKYAAPLGFIGGLCDAIGGGGWGPIVTSTLVARGHAPRFVVGSVNTVEFAVTLSQSIVFLLTIGLTNWHIIVGLLIGGVAAAPVAATFTKHANPRRLMISVGLLIIILSVRTIFKIWF